MPDILITGPTAEPLTLDEVKEHLRIDGTDEDFLVSSYILAAREWCEGYQNRKYITQTRELVLDDFPCYIKIPNGKLQSVTSIKYKDSAGVETTLAAAEYIVDTDSDPGKIVLAYNKTWPNFTPYPVGAVRVRYVCGYGDAEDVPQLVKQAMLLIVGHLHEHREESTEKALQSIPFGVKAILGLDRIWPV